MHTVLLTQQVGFCSHATTVTECEDSIRLERDDEDAPSTMLSRHLGSQQSGQVMQSVACCESADCNAKVVCWNDVCGFIDSRPNQKKKSQLIPFHLTNATSGLVTEKHPKIIRRQIKPEIARSSP